MERGKISKRKKPERPVQVKPCEWCGKSLPTVKYHLRICPDCRKIGKAAAMKELRRI